MVAKLITAMADQAGAGSSRHRMRDDDLMTTSHWSSARGYVDDGSVCELSSHHRHNVFTRSHHQTGSEQYQATTHRTVNVAGMDILGKWKIEKTFSSLPSEVGCSAEYQ